MNVIAATPNTVRAIQKAHYQPVKGVRSDGMPYRGGAFTPSNPSVGSSPVIALIVSGNSLEGYSVYIYGNGIEESYTATATGVFALDMAIADADCVGQYVYLYPSTITVTEG